MISNGSAESSTNSDSNSDGIDLVHNNKHTTISNTTTTTNSFVDDNDNIMKFPNNQQTDIGTRQNQVDIGFINNLYQYNNDNDDE